MFEPEEFLPDLRYNTVQFELNLSEAKKICEETGEEIDQIPPWRVASSG